MDNEKDSKPKAIPVQLDMDKKKFNKLFRLMRKNHKAFKVIMAYYQPRIRRHIERCYNIELVDPIIHEFAVRLWLTNPDTVIEYPTTWVYKICDNAVKEMYGTDPALSFTANIDQAIDRAHFSYEDKITIKAALLKLDPDSRSIVYLHYWEGYTFKEIAMLSGMTYDNVRKKHVRALKIIKRFPDVRILG